MFRGSLRVLIRVGLTLVVALLLVVGCGIVTPQTQTQPPPPTIDRSLLAANAPTGSLPSTGPLVTYTVTRGTIRDTISIPGRVVASRTAQVGFRSSGTISAINVRAGQAVSKDDVLAELTLDADAVQSLQSQATMADLTYENQLARIADLQRGAGPQALASARAATAKAQADLERAQLRRDALQQQDQSAEQARAASEQATDRQVTLAQIAVQDAEDQLDQARADVERLQAGPPATRSAEAVAPVAPVAPGQDQAQADAAAAAAQRAAQRKAAQAGLALQEAQGNPNQTKARRDLDDAQAVLARTDHDLKAAQIEAERPDRTKDPTGVIAAAAVDKIHSLSRDYENAQRQVAHAQDDLQAAAAADQRAIQLAQLAFDQAQDDLALATAAQAQPQASAQAGSGQPRDAGSSASASGSSDDPVAAAQAKERSADRQVQIAQLKLQDAQSAQAPVQAAPDETSKMADIDVQAAQAELDAAQAAEAELQQGPNVDALAREQRQAEVLQAEADRAHAALQPVQQLRAPFDGIVASMDAQLGQSADAHTPILRIVAAGTLSVTADASESDVARLEPGQTVDLNFPGLPDQTSTGTVDSINSAAPTTSTDGKEVTYPVQIDLESAPPQLKLGMTASLNLELRQATNVLHVPTAAVRKLEGHTVLTVVGPDGSLSDAAVQLGETYGSEVQVLGGVKEGDTVAAVAPVAAANTAGPKTSP